MIDKTIEVVWGAFLKILERLVTPFKTAGLGTFEFCFGLSEGLVEVFDNAIVKAFLYIINIFSWLVLAFALLFYFLKIAQEERRNWAVIMQCPVNTVIFVTLNQLLAKLCFIIPCYTVRELQMSSNLWSITPDDFFDALGGTFMGVLTPIFGVLAVIGFFIITIMRVSAMVIQMMIAPFYVPYVLMGEHSKSMEWVLGTVSIGFTYVIQYYIFYGGILMCTYGGKDIITNVIGIAFLLGTFSVPKLMQKFGWSSGAGHGFQSVAYSGNMLVSSARALSLKR